MKRSISLRTQIILLMTLLVILQNIAMAMSLSFSRTFYLLDAESFRLFNNTTASRQQTLNTDLGQLVKTTAEDTRLFNLSLQKIATAYANNRLSDLVVYNEIATVGADYLIHLLQSNNISGAFFLLEPNEKHLLPSVYIRNSSPKNSYKPPESFLLEIGPISVSQEYLIPTSSYHSLNFDFSSKSFGHPELFRQPIAAAIEYPQAEIERYGFWTNPTKFLPHSQDAVYYTLPLFNINGTPIGVMGIELTLNHFSQYYLPRVDLPYQGSFYAITQMKDNVLPLDWFISSNPLAQISLKNEKNLTLTPTNAASNIYSGHLDAVGDIYLFVQPLTTYSRNSPFVENNWSLVSFVPKETLQASSAQVRTILIISISLTTLVAFVAIFILANLSTRKISGLSEYIAGLDPYQDIHIKRTGMKEVDELSAAVEKLNQSVIHASETTSKILKLSLLPIGGFELTPESEQVIVTEYIYYLLNLNPDIKISASEWKKYYAELTASPAPEYENIYQYTISEDSPDVWLRILESNTSSGNIGVILDVTKEIEEHRRLVHELDFDSMTHLYNRKAFKREANAKIMYEPHKIGVMIFSDLDNLKYINDTFGHEIGDRLILRASEMFHEFGVYGGIVSRISGDEFAIYLHGFSSKSEAKKLIEKQLKRSERYELRTPDGNSHRIRFSSGLAWYPEDSNNITDLLKLSDFAMYEAKHKEKGVLYEFNKKTYESKSYLLENREAIHQLIDNRMIHFYFQPIVSLKTGEIYAYEALMRSSHPAFKSPAEILSVATAQSQLAQLERLVFSVALETIDRHIDELNGVRIFINSIPSHLMSQNEFLALEEEYEHFFSQLVIEVTERESDSLEDMSDCLTFLRSCGMRLALDDFGNGYSSEARILTVKPYFVKIDMMLIQGIHHDSDKQQLVSNLVSFCHAREIALVAEGVEEYADLAKLIDMNIDFVQGYYIARPAPSFEAVPLSVKEDILLKRARSSSQANKR